MSFHVRFKPCQKQTRKLKVKATTTFHEVGFFQGGGPQKPRNNVGHRPRWMGRCRIHLVLAHAQTACYLRNCCASKFQLGGTLTSNRFTCPSIWHVAGNQPGGNEQVILHVHKISRMTLQMILCSCPLQEPPTSQKGMPHQRVANDRPSSISYPIILFCENF